MKGRVFFDTNVLLYAYSSDAAKGARARQIFGQHADRGEALISTQVVQEFYAAGSKKLGIPRSELRDAMSALLELPLVVLGPMEIRAALEIEDQYGTSFWDALIVAAADSGGAEVLYTEDLNDGQSYAGVIVRNPFRAQPPGDPGRTR